LLFLLLGQDKPREWLFSSVKASVDVQGKNKKLNWIGEKKPYHFLFLLSNTSIDEKKVVTGPNG
jgi:hypothetical protein